MVHCLLRRKTVGKCPHSAAPDAVSGFSKSGTILWTLTETPQLASKNFCMLSPSPVECRVLGQHHSTQRKRAVLVEDEVTLTGTIVALALQYGCYDYGRIIPML